MDTYDWHCCITSQASGIGAPQTEKLDLSDNACAEVMQQRLYDLVVIGAGAAGVFAAISAKEYAPALKILILEKTLKPLSKVRVSGGGRCNVTHACFDPLQLSQNYPRGEKELIGPFQRFQPKNTFEWFASKGVELKIEEDGRCFPVTDSSETIINCFLDQLNKYNIELKLRQKIERLFKKDTHFEVALENETLVCKNLLLATGSSPQGYDWAKAFGHVIVEPVPSLFTFNITDFELAPLSGVSIADVKLEIPGTHHIQRGPLLITHFGFSGPAVLKLSAWAARFFHEKDYVVELLVNWCPSFTKEEIFKALLELKKKEPKKHLFSENPFQLPKNLWKSLVGVSGLKKNGDVPHKELQNLAEKLYQDRYPISGKTTHKEEFVTCGGVLLKEIDFKTMESKVCPHLYFAGEILDIDGITGGFNFQSAWTTGFIAGRSLTI